MSDFLRPPSSQEMKISISGFDILLRHSSSFAHFIRDGNSDELKTGVKECLPNRNVYTYGAGPCVAGIALVQKPYLFHINPNQFTKQYELIDTANWGIIGGSIAHFGELHPVVLTNNFIKKSNYPFSVAISNLGNNKLEILYGLH